MKKARRLWMALFPLFIVGCSGTGDDPPTTVPVTVQVTLDGLPLARANVTLVPTSTEGKTSIVVGITDDQGIAAMAYRGLIAGAPPGPYKVFVTKLVDRNGIELPPDVRRGPADFPPGVVKELLPAIYSDPQQTTLNAAVPPAGGRIVLPLTSSP